MLPGIGIAIFPAEVILFMRYLDLNSWQGILSTIIGLLLITLIGVGVRLLVMQTLQQRQQRENRQINERLRTLIAAYKALGGSFTGNLMIDPTHLRDLVQRAATAEDASEGGSGSDSRVAVPDSARERARRIRDTVEAALSDIILLGTEEQVSLAARAAREMVAGRPIHTDELVVSLRQFIREALGLEPISAEVEIPRQGPTRPSSGGAGARGARDGGAGGGGGRGGGGGMGAGAGMGMGMGMGVSGGSRLSDHDPTDGSRN